MTDHDPLCWKQSDGDGFKCTCLMIAETRADERERIAQMARSGVRAEAQAVRNLEANILALGEAWTEEASRYRRYAEGSANPAQHLTAALVLDQCAAAIARIARDEGTP